MVYTGQKYVMTYYGNNAKEKIPCIHLAGVTKYKDICSKIKVNSSLDLVYENDNEYDKNAIAVYYDTEKCGYIPKGTWQIHLKENNIKQLRVLDCSPYPFVKCVPIEQDIIENKT